MLQIQFIDRVVDFPVVGQLRVPTVQTVEQTVEILQVPFWGLVLDSPLLCIDRYMAYFPVIMQRQVLRRCVGGGASIQFIDKVVLRCGQRQVPWENCGDSTGAVLEHNVRGLRVLAHRSMCQ